MVRINGSRNLLASSDPLAKFLFSVPMTLCSASLEALVPKDSKCPKDSQNPFTRTHNNDFIELEVKIATQPFGAPHAFE